MITFDTVLKKILDQQLVTQERFVLVPVTGVEIAMPYSVRWNVWLVKQQGTISNLTSFSSSQLSQSENSSFSAPGSGLDKCVVPLPLSWDVSKATDSCITRPLSSKLTQ